MERAGREGGLVRSSSVVCMVASMGSPLDAEKFVDILVYWDQCCQ
jgi:hypothetical protein